MLACGIGFQLIEHRWSFEELGVLDRSLNFRKCEVF